MTDEQRRVLLEATIEYLDAVRTAYLRTPGASPMKHWDMLLERVRLACRTSGSVAEWTTTLARSLKLPAPSSYLSSALDELAAMVRENGGDAVWLEMVEREHAYVMARLRLWTEQRRVSNANAEV